MFKYIINNDIEIKLLDLNHAEELNRLINTCRTHLKRWLPWVEYSKDIEAAKSFINGSKKQFLANNGFQAGIWYRGELAGVIGYHNIDWSNKSTSIGYWLGEAYQGKGIMTEATKALVEYALVGLNLNRVEIRCAEENDKSRSIPERLDFTKEGVIRQSEWLYDHYVDCVIYSMLASEWREIRRSTL